MAARIDDFHPLDSACGIDTEFQFYGALETLGADATVGGCRGRLDVTSVTLGSSGCGWDRRERGTGESALTSGTCTGIGTIVLGGVACRSRETSSSKACSNTGSATSVFRSGWTAGSSISGSSETGDAEGIAMLSWTVTTWEWPSSEKRSMTDIGTAQIAATAVA